MPAEIVKITKKKEVTVDPLEFIRLVGYLSLTIARSETVQRIRGFRCSGGL